MSTDNSETGDETRALQEQCADLERKAQLREDQLRFLNQRVNVFGLEAVRIYDGDVKFEVGDAVHVELHRRFGADYAGPPVIRDLRRLYRQKVPLNVRLQLQNCINKLLGKDSP